MSKLKQHLSTENRIAIQELYTPSFGEVRRIIYSNWDAMIEHGVKRIKIYSDTVVGFENSQQIYQLNISLLNEMANVTYQDRFLEILRTDNVLSEHISVEVRTDEVIACVISYD